MPFELRTWPRRARSLLRTIFSGLLAAGVLIGGFAASNTQIASASTEPIYWGANVDGAPYDTGAIDRFESDAGKRASIIRFGQSWVHGSSWFAFPTKSMDTIRNRGSIPFLGWNSYDASKGLDQPDFSLARIASGAYDGYITRFATDAKNWGHPFFMRMDHEMNGGWYPWSEKVNGNHPGDYVRMWRHVHDIFTGVGATNVTWVWNPNITGRTSTPLKELYPGDSYVDWTGLDGYNWGTDKGAWQTFSQVFNGNYGGFNQHDSYDEMLAFAPNKPMMLPEFASTEHGGSKATWISNMLTSELPTRFPAIKAVVWENEVADNEPWPIESSSSAKAAFKAGIASDYYSGDRFNSISGKIQPLGSTAPQVPEPAPGAPGPASSSIALQPEADTYIMSASPDSTSGGSSQTLLAYAGTNTPFLRFDLSSLKGKKITGATLTLHATPDSWSGSNAAFDAMLVNSDTWSEASLSYNNTTPITGTVLGTLVAPAGNAVSSMTLATSVVQSNVGGKLSLALVGRTPDAFLFYSSEAGSSLAPQLVLTYK
jgi:Glycosyl hydrolase family 26